MQALGQKMNSLQAVSASKNNNTRAYIAHKLRVTPNRDVDSWALDAYWLYQRLCVINFLMHLGHADCSFDYFLPDRDTLVS